jgi:phage gp46-like protein
MALPVAPTARSFGAAVLDLQIDPLTRDLIDTSDGSWAETADSRTSVLFQLETTYGAWWADPTAGSRIRAILTGNDPGGAAEVRDEALRALQVLVDDGVITDLAVTLDTDENGRAALLLAYRDRASGRPVDLSYVPFGG